MKAVFAVLLFALPAFAQHGINLSWTQSTCPQTCTITKNTIYQAPTTAGPFTAIYTSSNPITSYLVPLTTTNEGTAACWEISATTTIESPLSSPTCNTFPLQAGAPSSVQSAPQ